MKKSEALELLRSGVELTEEQRLQIATVLQDAYVDDDEEGWDESGWNSSNCW